MKTKAQSLVWIILGIGIIGIIGLVIYSNYPKLEDCAILNEAITVGTLNSDGKCCEGLVAKAPNGFTGGAFCVNPSDKVECLRFTKYIPVEGIVRISLNGTMFPLKQVAQCPTPSLTESTCNSAGGQWNECGSRCVIENQGKVGITCTQVCEALCVCGGITGLNCPSGYACVTPTGIVDAMGYCKEMIA